MPLKDPERRKQYHREYNQKNRDWIREKHQAYYAQPLVRKKRAQYEKEYYATEHGKDRGFDELVLAH